MHPALQVEAQLQGLLVRLADVAVIGLEVFLGGLLFQVVQFAIVIPALERRKQVIAGKGEEGEG